MTFRLAILFHRIIELQRVVKEDDWKNLDMAHKRLFDVFQKLMCDYANPRYGLQNQERD